MFAKGIKKIIFKNITHVTLFKPKITLIENSKNSTIYRIRAVYGKYKKNKNTLRLKFIAIKCNLICLWFF